MSTMCVHTLFKKWRSCDTTSTVFLKLIKNSSNHLIAWLSKPFVGSSKRSISGSPNKARAKRTLTLSVSFNSLSLFPFLAHYSFSIILIYFLFCSHIFLYVVDFLLLKVWYFVSFQYWVKGSFLDQRGMIWNGLWSVLDFHDLL